MQDLTGKRFGRLTVLSLDYEHEKTRKDYNRKWICQCDCGNKKSVYGSALRSKSTLSCGCLNKEKFIERNHAKFEDLTGQKFNKLTVIRTFIINGEKVCECLCDCGNKTNVIATHLKDGHTKSCGCLQKIRAQETRFVDETGNKYGKLTVLKQDGWEDERREAIWICECECGNIVKVRGGNLRSGNSKSCGCIGASYGEASVEKLLKDNNIKYQREYEFDDLLSEKGNPLRFDFCIFKGDMPYYFIECDGLQHQEYNKFNYTKEESELLWARDRKKENYLLEHNYPLIRIPYDHYQNITLKDIGLQSNYLLVPKISTVRN